jgi:hypothetical protein
LRRPSHDALALDRDDELVLMHLQPHQECGVVNADRIESARFAHRWQVIEE